MKKTEAVNDLIEINNDRIAGYEKAANQASDEDLRTLFNNMAMQSRRFGNELKQSVASLGAAPAEGTTAKGKIYRTWMDVKATFTGDSRKSVLSSCEFGEDAAQHAYDTVLKEEEITGDIRKLIEKQKSALLEAHDKIKNLRDAQPA